MISPTFFGTMIQGEWIADDGSLYQPVTKYFGLLRLWDSRAVWHKMVTDTTALAANIKFAQSRNAQVMFTFGEPPASALLSGYSNVPTMDAWKTFVESTVRQAAGRVKYWELWNEPGIPGYWDGTPETLAAQSRVGYEMIKWLQPDAVVLSPSFTEMALARGKFFIGQYLAAGGGQWCDVIAFHGYAARPGDMVPDIDFLHNTLAAYGVSLPLWNTEYVIGPCADLAQRQEYMRESLVLQAQLGIEGAVWNSEIPGSEDYTDPTMQRIYDLLTQPPVATAANNSGCSSRLPPWMRR